MKAKLQITNNPVQTQNINQIVLSDNTYLERKKMLLSKMEYENIDVTIIYADREHSSNFEYFTGFVPRFEESLLVIHKGGESYLILGNENMKMAEYSRISSKAIHSSILSLPNQPMNNETGLPDALQKAKISSNYTVGVIGWKLFTTSSNNHKLFDVPYFILDAIKSITTNIVNFTHTLISPESGIRTLNSAEEIAYFEYGSTLAGNSILNAMNNLKVGEKEVDVARNLSYGGQPHTVTTICASGDRFTDAVVYPRDKQLFLGEKVSLTVGYKGGLSSRTGYIAESEQDLSSSEKSYLDNVAIPYYKTIATWLENIKIGTKGKDIYELIENVFPKAEYNWELNPGHLTSTEEWLSSPIFANSPHKVKSGQVYQIDIIPNVKGYAGVSCEDGVAIADEELRNDIKINYPLLWERFEKRRNFIIDELGIVLPNEVLPMNDIVAYYRPFLLNKQTSLAID